MPTTLDPATALILIDLQDGITALPTVDPSDQIVARGARLADHEGDEEGDRAGPEAERVGRAPAVVGGLDDRVDAHHHRADDEGSLLHDPRRCRLHAVPRDLQGKFIVEVVDG